MTMKFYDALQMDPSVLKRKIASCDTKHDRAYYWTAIAVRSVLIVGFAIIFISLLSGIFGSDNTPLAVALFCMMLGIRFVNFEYCIRDSLAALAAVLAILVLAPSAAALLPPFFLIPLHFTAFFALLYMTTQRPEMGNGGLYSFAYIYLTGNPVFGVERFMWMGFACASLLSEYPYSGSTLVRFRHRIVGAVAGSFAFFDLSGHSRSFSPVDGSVGRDLPGLLHGLPVQNSNELLRCADAGRRDLRPSGSSGSSYYGYFSRCNIRPGLRGSLSPAGCSQIPVRIGERITKYGTPEKTRTPGRKSSDKHEHGKSGKRCAFPL